MSLPTCQTCVYAKGICKKTGVGIRPTTGCTYHTPKSVTKADCIRAMTDEELAEWLERIRLCCATDLCGRRCPFAEICFSNAEEPKETLDWLKQEADHE